MANYFPQTPRLDVALRVTLGAVFLFSGLSKVLGYNDDLASLLTQVFASKPLIWAVEATLPLVEICLGTVLITARAGTAAPRAAAAFLTLLTGFLVWLLLIGASGSCGCGLPGGESLELAVARNLVLIALASFAGRAGVTDRSPTDHDAVTTPEPTAAPPEDAAVY